METNVSRTVHPAEDPDLLARRRPYDGVLSRLDDIGFLFDRGAYMEVRYDGCNHSTEFLCDRMSWQQAADLVRAELPTCGTCDFVARVARVLGESA
jgi:hypothetical protein